MASLKKLGQGIGNTVKLIGDSGLGSIGMGDVINERSYNGDNVAKWDKGANIAGKIGGVGLQVAGNIVAPGIGGAVVGGVQQAGSMANNQIQQDQFLNSQAMQATQPPQPYYNTASMVAQPMPINQYANGGYVGLNPNIANGNLAMGIYHNMRSYANGGMVNGYKKGGLTSERIVGVDQTIGNNGFSLPQGNGYQNTFQLENIGMPQSNSQYTSSYTAPQVENGMGDNGTYGDKLGGYVALGSLGLGAFQTAMALRNLNQANKQPIPTLGVSNELQTAYNQAQQNAQSGFSQQEKDAYMNNLAVTQNTAQKNALTQSGGNLAQAINAGLKSQNIDALNNFASQDAALKRQNRQYANSFAGQYQNIANQNNQNAYSLYLEKQRALGGALSQGTQTLANSLDAYVSSRYGVKRPTKK